jgi:hypothetical protein
LVWLVCGKQGEEHMKEDIIRMAREAGFKRHHNPDLYDCMVASDEAIERFAALVADAEAKRMHAEGMVTVGHMRQQIAAEREACAKLCNRMEQQAEGTECCKWPTPADCAEAIRARGQT